MARRLLDGCRRTFGEFVGDRVEPTAGIAVAIVVGRLQVNDLSQGCMLLKLRQIGRRSLSSLDLHYTRVSARNCMIL